MAIITALSPLCFLIDFDLGFYVVDRVYIHDQPRKPFQVKIYFQSLLFRRLCYFINYFFYQLRLQDFFGLIHVHMFFSGVALVCGALQFNATLRSLNVALHQTMGSLYVVSLLLGSVGAVQFAWLRGK